MKNVILIFIGLSLMACGKPEDQQSYLTPVPTQTPTPSPIIQVCPTGSSLTFNDAFPTCSCVDDSTGEPLGLVECPKN